jgi:AraC-like DNA-binding protein
VASPCRRTGPPAAGPGQIAADAGYADQAHPIRDFRQLTGLTAQSEVIASATARVIAMSRARTAA